MNYLDELNALLERYTQAEVADLLDVTDRTLQFWMAEENRKVPFAKSQRNIHEIYTKIIVEGKTIEDLLNIEEPEPESQATRIFKINVELTAICNENPTVEDLIHKLKLTLDK